MISREELKRMAGKNSVEAILERDYVMGWILKYIYEQDILRDILVFKGGTALRKAYFDDYRFSVDLDFTASGYVSEEILKKGFENIIKDLEYESGMELIDIEFIKTRDEYNEEAFEIKIPFIGPRLQRFSPQKIKVQVTRYEKIFLIPAERQLIHQYSDKRYCKAKLKVYRIEEIIGEKLRALHQRIRPRDLYDLYYLFKTVDFNKNTVCQCFVKKCEYKNIDFENDPLEKTEDFKNAWERSLIHLVVDLPGFNEAALCVSENIKEIKKICVTGIN